MGYLLQGHYFFTLSKNYNATGIITENFYSRSHPNSPWIDEIADRKEQKRIEELAKTDRHQYSNYKPATIEIDVDKILTELPIGSRVMLGNFDENARGTAWAHENMIKIGDDKYYAHPLGEGTLKYIKYELAKQQEDNPTQEYIDKNIYIQHMETYKQKKQ